MFGFKKKTDQVSIRAHWQNMYARDASDFEQILRNDVVWADWDRNLMIESAAERRFFNAIEILSGSDNWDLARRYAERSLEIIERVEAEGRLPTDDDRYPRNRGRLHRTKVYASSFLGQAWDAGLLLSASRDYETHCRETYPDKKDWDSQIQYYFLNSVHLAALGGDLERAYSLLRSPPFPLDAHSKHVNLLFELIQLSEDKFDHDERLRFVSDFDTFFNEIRDPRWMQPDGYFMETIGPLEIGLLRDRYILHPGENLSWERVISDYSS